jgi:dihydrolipoamide dehydrogenase
MVEQFDVIVIGGGPGGYVAAIRAAQAKKRVALVEREHLGGVCLNWGCIPTKALLKVASVYSLCNKADKFGIQLEGVKFDLSKMVEYSRTVADKLARGVEGLMKKNAVTVISGVGRLLGAGKVEVLAADGAAQVIVGKNIIIATGARPREIPAVPVDGRVVWNYKHAMTPKQLPSNILIVGSGAIGMEFASFYNALGVKVTVVEVAERILSHEDEEVSASAAQAFAKKGIEIFTKTEVLQVKPEGDEVRVKYRGMDQKVTEATFSRVISAVGVVANIEGIGLESTKVKVEKGVIKTNGYMQTDEPGVYAIGDVVSAPWLAHKASHEAIVCVAKIVGGKVHEIKRENIPACTYTSPEIASVGMTERQARQKYSDIKVGKFPFYANGKAIAVDETDGFAKLIFDAKTGELLGAHLIGAGVTEMIAGLVMAKELEATEEQIMNSIMPHPTMSEAVHEAALAAWGEGLHL